jgi:HAD superfamily hydrolase (TIGR01549 family)
MPLLDETASTGTMQRARLCPRSASTVPDREEAGVKAVLFDVDDTLFDRARAQREMPEVIRRTFPDLFAGIPPSTVGDAFLASDRISTEQFNWTADVDAARLGRSRIFLRQLGLAEELAPALTALYVTHYPRIEAPVHGARQMLERLSVRYRLGVVSNGMPDIQYRKLETLGVRRLFGCILLSGETGMEKPDPRIFRQAANRLDVAPEDCLHVGDTYGTDVTGAQAAGMRACWYNPHARSRPQGCPQPELEVCALSELLALLS